mmetsp:Transcript_3236/g.9931  ORF Transcript_3236/g.9931 Transcript_3236/m.9931 type:complete len:260 (-) Transcript_3236:289-1068(-)
MTANTNKMPSAANVSRVSDPTFCCENSIICMSSPCEDEKPVRRTYATAPPSGGGGGPVVEGGAPGLVGVALTSSVPEKSTDTRSAPWMSRARSGSSVESASFIWGVDSPVSVASFETADPRTSTQSQGTMRGCRAKARRMFVSRCSRCAFWSFVSFFGGGGNASAGGARRRATLMRSPGSRSSDDTSRHAPCRKQSSGWALADMPESDLSVFWRCMTVPASMNVMEKSVNPTYCQYASRSHSKLVKTWNMAMGLSNCSL